MPSRKADAAMVKALARAFRRKRMLDIGHSTSISDREKIGHGYVGSILRLTLLAPDIIGVVLNGRQPVGFALPLLLKPFPDERDQQCASLLGFQHSTLGVRQSAFVKPLMPPVPAVEALQCGESHSGPSAFVLRFHVPPATVAMARIEGDRTMTRHDLLRQLTGWRQTTAEILYRMPDHPTLVQTFVWQDMDRWHDDPKLTYPRLRRFCEWWNANLDGPIVQIRVAGARVVTAGELRHIDAEIRLH